jgi:CRP-like cAMP-binding protein
MVKRADDALLELAQCNRILNALPEAALKTVLAETTVADLKHGHHLYREDGTIQTLYFPVHAVVAILERPDQKDQAVMATIGNEGAVGISITMGVRRPLGRKIVQESGPAITIRAKKFIELLKEFQALSVLMHRYLYAFLREILQTGACNQHHSAAERCARHLLLAHDRAGHDEFPLTQRALADNLSVPRRKINRALGTLREQGAIKYIYRNITVTDRLLLEACACPCYREMCEAHSLVRL